MTASLSEHGLIATYFAPLAANGGLKLLDDAAILTPGHGCDLVMTVDAVVAGVHFLPDDDPRDIACKALGVNVSDLAAKGAEPKGFLLTLGLAGDWQPEWLAAFAQGLGEAAKRWCCPLYGGDTVRADGAPFLSVTAFGEVPSGRMVRRSGAHTGDIVCVSGTVGDAALGLRLALGETPDWAEGLDDDERKFLIDRYRRPQPRLPLAPVVRDYATAAMDVSDGLIGDLEKLLAASETTAEVDLGRIPLSQAGANAFRRDADCLETIVTGGDDYEVLCTVRAEEMSVITAAAAAVGMALHPIGKITKPQDKSRYILNGAEVYFSQGAFSHF